LHNRQFYTYKFKSSRLKVYNYNINITFDKAKEIKEVIALADNQILRSIRDIRKRTIDYQKLERLFKERDIRKRRNNKKNSKENSERIIQIQDKINRTMFIPDYITVVMEHPSHYKKLYNDGLIINGKLYKRFSCSAGQARVSTVMFCCVEILDELNRRLNNGRDLTEKIAPSKFNAYFGLSGSSTYLVSEPKFIVVKDFVNTDKFKANYVIEKDWNIDDDIEIREIELEMNRTDGMGLISPKQAYIWAKELGLDWVPSQFCIRQNFIKGMLCTFPIHEFCEEVNDGNYIVDTIYKDQDGNYIKVDLRDYEVIITESQFKLWDSFPNIDTYINNCQKNKLYWGISQYTPKQAKNVLKLNYQFIQTLDLKQENIEKLSQQFVDWICGVSYDDVYYMLLFLLGTNNSEHSIKEYLRSSDNYWIKSLIINHELKNDKYILTKIKELIKTRIKNGCMGDIFVDGNFQVLVYDPYGFMQHVCGLKVTGLLKKGEFYSNYWNERNVKQVNGMRSPLTYRSEHVILDLIKNEDTEKWYKYCKLGIILNYHGHEVVNFGGADVDYDILATTSNQEIVNGVYKDEIPVVYTPPKPQKIVFTEDDLYYADTFSFGSIIGSITNKSSNGYALLPNLEKKYGKISDEYKITLSRLKQCCKAQSAQIDKAKIGREVKGIPKLWIHKRDIEKDTEGFILDSEEEIKQKKLYNRILLSKYPYFFKYLYKNANSRYKKYCDENEITCHQKFKMSFSKLKELDRLSIEQKQFINNFYNYMPLTYSDSSMNLLCKYIESINFEMNKKIKIVDMDIVDYYKNDSHLYSEEQYKEIVRILKEHISGVKFDKISKTSDDLENNDYNEDDIREFQVDNDLLENKLNDICSDVYLVTNVLLDYFYKEKPSSNKDILWGTYGKYIYQNVKENNCKNITFPFPSKDGDIKYLGSNYSLKEVNISEIQ
jgi:hypothetical protein